MEVIEQGNNLHYSKLTGSPYKQPLSQILHENKLKSIYSFINNQLI